MASGLSRVVEVGQRATWAVSTGKQPYWISTMARRRVMVPSRGAAIFLHYATRYTAGCVSMDSLSKLTNTLRWIDPAQNPKIIILG